MPAPGEDAGWPGPEDRRGRLDRGTLVDDGTWAFDALAGQRYVAGWFDETHRPVERLVTVERGSYDTRVRLVVGPEVLPGELRVRVLDQHGRLFGPRDSTHVDVEVCSAETGQVLWHREAPDRRLWSTDRPEALERQRWTLPPGRYVVRARPYIWGMRCGNGPPTVLRYGRVETALEVLPGGAHEVVLRPWLGGRVRFDLQLPSDARDPRLIRPPGTSDSEDRRRRVDLLKLDWEGRFPGSRVLDVTDGARRELRFHASEEVDHSDYGGLLPTSERSPDRCCGPGGPGYASSRPASRRSSSTSRSPPVRRRTSRRSS